jgi:ribosomal 50S subunit-associated protein YjgA (DUF615 family)
MPQAMMPLKLTHLTRDQHLELARLLNQVEDNLTAATRIVSRAQFTDRMLYIARTVQTRLIEPLSEAWGQLSDEQAKDLARLDRAGCSDPYQNVGYGRGHR